MTSYHSSSPETSPSSGVNRKQKHGSVNARAAPGLFLHFIAASELSVCVCVRGGGGGWQLPMVAIGFTTAPNSSMGWKHERSLF